VRFSRLERCLGATLVGLLGWTISVGVVWAAPQAPARPTPPPAAAKPATSTTAAESTPAKTRETADPFVAADSATSSTTDVRETDVYGDRLDGLQAEINALKDKIFRSKARLSVLRDTVLRGVLSGSRIVLSHRNLMGSSFRLVRVVCTLDGAQIYARTDETGSLDSEDEVVIYDGNLSAGPHRVSIDLVYKGNGYGVFAYLAGYTFESTSQHEFTAPERGALKLGSVGYEEGNLTTEMHDRPAVSWQEVPLDAAGRPLASRRPSKGK